MGHSEPALLTQILFKADPYDPLASKILVGPATQRADPAHSHPDFSFIFHYRKPHTNGYKELTRSDKIHCKPYYKITSLLMIRLT